MALGPTATQITVREVLAKFEGSFAPVATAVENGEYAFWVGSGISRKAPSLGVLVEVAFDYLRDRATAAATAADFLPALEEALRLAEVDPATVQARYSEPLANWPEHDAIVDKLWRKYSRLLDIRIPGKPSDYMLWDAIDVRKAFENPKPPAAEHLCIAILILEGAIQAVASANWDGFIEAAVQRLTGSLPGVLQVIVDPDQLRSPVGRARLLKFHGCIVHATREPTVFRRYLTGSYTQIMAWPEAAEFAAMRNVIVNLATTQKTLVLGLSIQDNNLQTIFARAKEVHAWPWPCAPQAPGHVFCENEIQQGQRDVLRLAYGEAYNANPPDVHDGTLLRAWGEQVLIALVLRLLVDKLARLMELGLASVGKATIASDLRSSLIQLRNLVADQAVGDRTAFADRAIGLWSRALSIFRQGDLPTMSEAYEALSNSSLNLIDADQNARAMSLDRFAIAVALLGRGHEEGRWLLEPPASNDLTAGVLTTRAPRPGGDARPIFVVRSATEAISLQSKGAFANDTAIVIHADETWDKMVSGGASARRVRSPPGRVGRIGETHVSLNRLLGGSADAATLHANFAMEVFL
ncbi:SIR2 family protein [Caulobacter sp. KR2-114]|uniref:SIR2 family protein n=1 Tax=Caulobacter sp. KR2-114 TaxID=3400912 RepID=UPI003C0B8C02